MDNLDDLELLSKDELMEMLRERADVGVTLTFPGKAVARRIARKVRPRVQRPVAKYSAGTDEQRSQNLLIEGDNLQGLATLYKERSQVDLILTDPPYNTGNDFRYNDRWDENPNDPGLGEFVSADDRARHTKWMRFMYPRLRMMHSMLKPGGVLAICIDHRELFRLGQMLDEIFNESNRLAIINWQKSYAPRNDKAHVSTATEYVLIYAKDADRAKTGLLERSDITTRGYRNPDNDPENDWVPTDPTARGDTTHPGSVYAIQNPFTGVLVYPTPGRHWMHEKVKIHEMLEEWGSPYEERDIGESRPALMVVGSKAYDTSDPAIKKSRKRALAIHERGQWPRFFFRMAGEGTARYKTYLSQARRGVVPTTYWADEDLDSPVELGTVSWDHEESGHSQSGVKELDAIVGKGHAFTTVKPLKLIKKIILLWCPPGGLVLDPFAGSGTVGHAVLDLNDESGATRRFILIEQGRPENGDSYARTLTADRLQRVISGVWAADKRKKLTAGFEFRQLTRQVDANALLQMEREEMVDTVIASYFDVNRRRGSNLIRLASEGFGYLVAKNSDGEGFYLVWDGPDKNTDLTEEVYECCVAEGQKAGLKPTYHVYARFNLFSTDGVWFYQIPDRILADFGLDVRTESYGDEDPA